MTVPLVAGLFGALHPALDAMAHFRLHLAGLAALAALPLLITARWRHGLATIAVCLAVAAYTLGVPGIGIGSAGATYQPKPVAAKTYRLLQLNLLYNNREPERVEALLRTLKPEIVTLNEVSGEWVYRLRGLLAEYPYQINCARGSGIDGTAILSRLHLSAEKLSQCSPDGSLAIATLDADGTPVDVAALHLHWPWPSDQARQIERLTPLLQSLSADAILAGDFNAAPWSAAVRWVAEAGSLTPSPLVGPTWLPIELPGELRPLVGLPLDQVQAKGIVRLHGTTRLDAVGSDHLPVLVEFSLPKPAGAPETTASGLALSADTISASGG